MQLQDALCVLPIATKRDGQGNVLNLSLITDDMQAIICYHGGVVDADAQGQLRRVARELAA
jgi:hypothetical protein